MAVPSLAPAERRMTKAAMREAAKVVRDAHFAALDGAARDAAARTVADHIIANVGGARTVALYLPIGSEIDPRPAIERLHAAGTALALPHVAGRNDAMRFLGWSPGAPLVPGPLGLRQPDVSVPEASPDLILTPLLAFDRRGHRLGYGAGHYDRAFAAHPAARRVGLAWTIQAVDAIAEDPWDVPLHAIATENDWIEP